MHTNSYFKQILFLISIIFFASCDKDYNEIGADIINQNNFEFTIDSLSTVDATWKKIGAIASNNLDINSLGVLDNSVFGQTTANYATQVQLASINPSIDVNLGQNVESVTLYIPYFSTKTATDSNGISTYTLESIYGNKTSKIKLSIYENKFLLGNLNTEGYPAPLADPSYLQFYYTSQNNVFNDNKGKLLYESNDFIFSPIELVDTPAVGTTPAAYKAPGMLLNLDKTFFQDLLFNANSSYNLSSSVFENYFKGLYFNVEKTEATGVLAMMNFKKGTIVVKYKEKTSSTVETLVDKSITLNLTGNSVNLLNNEPSIAPNSYSSPQADRLYLRGGEGSVATIDFFNSGVDDVSYNRSTKTIDLTKGNAIPDELDYIKEQGWLINEASLTFYVDQTLMANATAEPTNIFLYDINNQRIISAGVIETDASKKGIKYKVNITDYIRGLVLNDNVYVKLGVSVAQSLSNANFKKVKAAPNYSVWSNSSTTTIYKNSFFFPESSVMNPLGTILYGSNQTVPEGKRLKLKIRFTKPN